MFKYLFHEKRTLAFFSADVLVLTGVAFLNWNPARMIGFYYLDVSFCILAFLGYNIYINKRADVFSMILATGVILGIMYFLFWALTAVNYQLNFGDYRSAPFKLFIPYYDLALFITFSGYANMLNAQKYLKYHKEISQPAFSLYLGRVFVMIPALWVLSFVFNLLHLPLRVSLILSLIAIRHYIEYKRYRSFIAMDVENKQMISKLAK